MSAMITDELTQNALKQAILRCNPAKGLIHHSDRGSQYASGDYQELLKNHGITPSMSCKGDCWDNAVGESFLHMLKVEKINRCRFRTREEAKREIFGFWAIELKVGNNIRTREEAKREIFEYVEMYYNRKRAHSSLGYMSPFEFEKRFATSLQTVH